MRKVFVRVASLFFTNIFGGNDLTFTDSRTNIDFTYLATFEPLSTSTEPFYNFAYGGNVAVYQAVFNTSGMLPGVYSMDMLLKATGTSNYVFDASQTLYITDEDSYMSYYPVAWSFKDSGYLTEWGYSKTAAFNATGTNYMIYVAFYVQDAIYPPSPSVGEVRVVDMVGGTQLYGPPGSGSMISAVTKSATNSTAYVFSIDLRLNNGDKWKTGTNSYTLEIAQFSDSNEGVYSYSRQIFVKASTARADFFMGTNGIYSSKGGSTNFINPEYVYYTENNNFFTSRVLYQQDNAPSTAPLYYHNAMALGDLDNDGDQDLLVGSNMESSGSSYVDFGQLLYFENTMNTWGNWQSPSVITRPTGDASTAKIEWIDMGDINNDGDMDFAYSTNAHKVIIYNNTYGAGGTVFATYAATNDGVRKVALEDMTGDERADLIVLAEGKIFMYDLTKWTSGLFATIPYVFTITSNIEDFDIADMNNDGMLDIITVDPTAGTGTHDFIEGVWVNNYTANTAPDMAKVDTSIPVLQPAGTLVTGTSSSTLAVDGSPMSLRENASGEDDDRSAVVHLHDRHHPSVVVLHGPAARRVGEGVIRRPGGVLCLVFDRRGPVEHKVHTCDGGVRHQLRELHLQPPANDGGRNPALHQGDGFVESAGPGHRTDRHRLHRSPLSQVRVLLAQPDDVPGEQISGHWCEQLALHIHHCPRVQLRRP